MTTAEIVAQHIEAMHALTTANLAEVRATSDKLRSVLGDPYAAYRALHPPAETEPAAPVEEGPTHAER